MIEEIRYAVWELKWLLLRLQGVMGIENAILHLSNHNVGSIFTEVLRIIVTIIIIAVTYSYFHSVYENK